MSLSNSSYKLIKSSGKTKFAISTNESIFFNEILVFLNLFSLLKNVLNYFSKPIIFDDLLKHKEFDWIPKDLLVNADFIILGSEKYYSKATIINKTSCRVIKFLSFDSINKAQVYSEEFIQNYKSHSKLIKKNININIDVEEIVNVVSVKDTLTIISKYENSLQKLNILDMKFLIDRFISYISTLKQSEVRHCDFKIYNVRKKSNGKLFLFDLESLCKQFSNKAMIEVFLQPYNINKKISISSFLCYSYFKKRLTSLKNK